MAADTTLGNPAARRGRTAAAWWLAAGGTALAAAHLLHPHDWDADALRQLAAAYLGSGLVVGFGVTAVTELVASHREQRAERRHRADRDRQMQAALAAMHRNAHQGLPGPPTTAATETTT